MYWSLTSIYSHLYWMLFFDQTRRFGIVFSNTINVFSVYIVSFLNETETQTGIHLNKLNVIVVCRKSNKNYNTTVYTHPCYLSFCKWCKKIYDFYLLHICKLVTNSQAEFCVSWTSFTIHVLTLFMIMQKFVAFFKRTREKKI